MLVRTCPPGLEIIRMLEDQQYETAGMMLRKIEPEHTGPGYTHLLDSYCCSSNPADCHCEEPSQDALIDEMLAELDELEAV